MSKELFEKNELVHITETGERVVLASVNDDEKGTVDPLKRTIDAILPSDDDMLNYTNKCRYYHTQYVHFLAANY
jgi:phosphatidylserine decarboxylase